MTTDKKKGLKEFQGQERIWISRTLGISLLRISIGFPTANLFRLFNFFCKLSVCVQRKEFFGLLFGFLGLF
jgi:hypothetical protein